MPARSPTPSRPKKWRGRFLSGINLVLFLSLLAQGWVWWQRSVPVPEFVLDRVARLLEAEGLTADAGSAAFHAPDRLVLDSVRVESRSRPGLTLESDRVVVQFPPSALFSGKLDRGNLHIRNARLSAPDQGNEPGNRDFLVRDADLSIAGYDGDWEVRGLTFRIAELAASVSGPLPRLPDEPPPAVDDRSWDELLVLAAEHLASARNDYLAGIRDGYLGVALGTGPSGAPSITARLTAAQFRHETGVSLEFPRIHARFDGTDGTAPGFIDLRARNARYRGDGEMEDLRVQATLPPAPGPNDFLPTEILATAAVIDARGVSASHLWARADRIRDEVVDVSWFLQYKDAPARGSGRIDGKSGTGVLAAALDINPTDLLDHPRAREAGFQFDVSFQEEPELSALLEFGPSWEPQFADLELRAGPCTIDGVELDAARALAHWKPDRLFDVPILVLIRDDFRVAGSFSTDMQTRDYRLLLGGAFRPLHISPWFRDWWVHLWNEFDFRGGPPDASIDLQGNWDNREKLSLLGWTEAEYLDFREVDVDRMRARYRVTSDYAHVFDGKLEASEKAVEGSFLFRHGEVWHLEFDVDANLYADTAFRLLGAADTDLARAFTFETSPRVRARGHLSETAPDSETRIEFAAESPSALTFLNLPFEYADITGNIAGALLTVDLGSVGFAGGTADGSVQLDRGEEEDRLRVQFSLRDAAFGEAIYQIAQAHAPPEAEGDEEQSNLRELGGKADFEMEATGRPADLLSFEGEGNINIREAELGQVRLLGLLSRILERTPLRFTSLQVSQAESTFQLRGETIHFPDMQLRGTNIRLEANGDYLIEDGALDFKVKLFPLGESPIPFVAEIFGRILSPVGHALEMSLTGTLADPNWRLPFDPRIPFDEAPERPQRSPGRPTGR